ncbi:helix-turn-helix domain-containing protein [Spongisporangium articulatum]|uniref:Helix-turn-helix domain-containing protein n=1 Tax=Spongisporangium articulatum TaxID=3362603 RepID=A0ABW8AQS0_9ACTN
MSSTATGDSSGKGDLARDVGGLVRARRLEAGLSVAELARRTGVSGPFISQLEAGRSSLSIPTLYRIADALDVSPNALLPGAGADRPDQLVTRAGHGTVLAATESPSPQQPRLITRTGPGVALEGYVYLIHPTDDEQQWWRHPGEDLVHVTRGRIVIEFEDGREVELGPGDSLHHDGDVAHRWRLVGDDDAEAVTVVTRPAREPQT